MNSEPASKTEQDGGDEGLQRGNRSLMNLFFVLAGANIAGLIWIAMRAGSPEEVRTALDVLFQVSIGAGVAAFAFRALTSYPFVMTDLLGMTLVLAAWSKLTVNSVNNFSQTGFLPERGSSQIGILIQYFLLSASVLLGGAAIGLWACARLSIQRPLARLFTLIPAMLSLPAAAGCAAFIALALGEFGERGMDTVISKRPVQSDVYMSRALVWMLLWFVSFILTVVNAITIIRAMALDAVVKDKASL